jgi:acyl dehydratase
MRVNYVTDEVKAVIGAHNGPVLAYHPVEASEVRRFFQATMDPSPRYWDAAWASTSRYGGLVAPPAFPPLSFRRAPTDTDPLDNMTDPDFDGHVRSFRGLPPVNVPLVRLLNGGYEYEFYRYARIVERIYRSSTYLDIYQREGRSGTMVFVIAADMFTTDGPAAGSTDGPTRGHIPLITVTTTSIMR